jgi:hypothetical protein
VAIVKRGKYLSTAHARISSGLRPSKRRLCSANHSISSGLAVRTAGADPDGLAIGGETVGLLLVFALGRSSVVAINISALLKIALFHRLFTNIV